MIGKLFISGILLACSIRSGVAQPATLSGLVNKYTKVSAIQRNNITVGSSAGFAIGDEVLIIQLQGAVVNVTNTAAFGSTPDLNHTGNYEFAVVQRIAGTIITVDSIKNIYDPTQPV